MWLLQVLTIDLPPSTCIAAATMGSLLVFYPKTERVLDSLDILDDDSTPLIQQRLYSGLIYYLSGPMYLVYTVIRVYTHIYINQVSLYYKSRLTFKSAWGRA